MDFLANVWERNDLWLLYMQRTSTDTKAVALLIILMAFRIVVLERICGLGIGRHKDWNTYMIFLNSSSKGLQWFLGYSLLYFVLPMFL